MTEVAPVTPRSRGPGHRTNSPLRAPPRHPPLSSRVQSRTATPRRGSSPIPPRQTTMGRLNPSAESIHFELVDDDNSIRFFSEDPTHRTASPAPGMQPSMASSEIEFRVEPSSPPQRGRSTATEKSDIQFFVEPTPAAKSVSPEAQVVGVATPPTGRSTPQVLQVPSAQTPVADDADTATSTAVSPVTPPPQAPLSPTRSTGDEDVSVAPTPPHAAMNDTLPPESNSKRDQLASSAANELTSPPAAETPATPAEHEAVPQPEPAPLAPANSAPQDKSIHSTSDVFADVPFDRSGDVDGGNPRYIDISEDESTQESHGDREEAKADATKSSALTPNQIAAQERRRSSFMPTVWDRPWKDPALQGATNKPPPMAPAPYERRKHGEHEPWDPKPTAAMRPSGAVDAQEDQTRALTPRPRDPKPWLVNSVLDPRRRRSTSAGARSPRKASAAANADGETPTITPRQASGLTSPRQEAQDSRAISPRADTADTASEDTEPVVARAAPPEEASYAPRHVSPLPPSAVMSQEVQEWNDLVTQQATLQFLAAQVRERERLVTRAAASLEALSSTDARITREVYAARDAVIRRTGADVNGDALQPVRHGRSRSGTPSRRRARTPSREAFVDRLYPFDSVAKQATDYTALKRETRQPSVLSDDELDEIDLAENAEDLDDWRDERDLLRDERAVLKQQNAELQFHMRRGTNIKGLTDIQPVTPRTPLARNMRKQSTAVDIFGYDRLAQLRIEAKESEMALEKARREHDDVAAKANDWPTRLGQRRDAVSEEHAQAKDRYMEALSALDDTLARARVLRVNLEPGQASANTHQDINGTPVPAIMMGGALSEDNDAATPVATRATGEAGWSPRPTTTASVTPRGSAVPMSARRFDSKQLLGAKLDQARALAAASRTREQQTTTPRTGRRGRSGSRSARRRSASPQPSGVNEYSGDGAPRAQSVHDRLSSHKTLSTMNRETPVSSPERHRH